MNDKILLSICIPTYNRYEYLDKTICSIVKQKKFQATNEVEIVISDNCSDDATKEISEKYIAIYGEKIRYHRNAENITDANYEKVLSLGKGVFLKLNNDTLMHQDNTLDKIIELINQSIENKDVIFFSNGTLRNTSMCRCKDLNSFVKTVSFYSTWIVCFGIWKEDFDSIDGFSRNAKLQLVQTDVLFRLISLNRSVLVENSKIFNSVSPSNKGGYNLYKVFVTNYLAILKQYSVIKLISQATLFNEKSKLMKDFLIPWTIDIWRNKKKFNFDNTGAVRIIFAEYRFHPAFYLGFVYLVLKILWMVFKDLFKNFKNIFICI